MYVAGYAPRVAHPPDIAKIVLTIINSPTPASFSLFLTGQGVPKGRRRLTEHPLYAYHQGRGIDTKVRARGTGV